MATKECIYWGKVNILKRFGQIAKLKSEMKDEYIRLHEDAWPEVLKTLKECNIQNYSIFHFELFCFAYFEYTGEDFEADMQKMATDPITQKWWSHTKPCFEKFKFSGDDEYYVDMKEIFRLD